MKLSSDLAHDFSDTVRRRGLGYFTSGAVRIQHGSDTHVFAHVQGARDYEVSVAWETPALVLCCDCPYFDSTGACKHLWATILAAEAGGHLRAVASVRPENVI